MSIAHPISSTTRNPGSYVAFNEASAARGFTPLEKRIVIVAPKSSAGTVATLTPTQVFTEAEADDLAGRSSELALYAKWALRGVKAYQRQPLAKGKAQVWICAIADPAGTARVNTFTVAAGTATEAGELVARIAGRMVRANVNLGDDQDAAALALDAAIDELAPELHVTSAVDGANDNEVNCTSVNTGVNANDALFEALSFPAGLGGFTVAQATAGAGAYDITAALDVLNDRDYQVVSTGNHTSTDVSDYAAHITDMWDPAVKRWRWTMLAETGSLATGQALATAADDWRQLVVSAEGFRNLPGEIAAYVGAYLASEENPNMSFSGLSLPDLFLPDAGDVPLAGEIESAIAGGMTILSVNPQGTSAEIRRAVTTKVTHASVPFFHLLDYGIGAGMAWFATQVDIAIKLAFPRGKKNARTKKAIRSVIYDLAKEAERVPLEVLQNVDAHAGQLDVVDDPAVASRAVAVIPTSITPGLEQVVQVMNLIVE